MQTEFEAKILDTDHDDIRLRLKRAGGECVQPMRLLHRAILDYPGERLQKNNSYVRVRNEGHKTTLTFKKFDAASIDGAKEIELVVDDFDRTVQLFKAVGMELVSEQESKRETWHLDNCEVVLDEWPWLKPYIEVEGPDQQSVRQAVSALGFGWDDVTFGDVTVAYLAEYDIKDELISKHARISFDDPIPALLADNKI